MAAFMAASAWAQSSKAVFGYNEVIALIKTQSVAGTGETGWINIMTVFLKTANNKDLVITPSLQCGVVTDGTVKSKGGGSNSTTTRGRIRVRVRVELSDGTEKFAEPSQGVDATAADDGAITNADLIEGITYCDRVQTLEAKFAGLNCTADPITGVVTCANPEELRLILKTLTASTFVFGLADVLSGDTKIQIQAKALASVALTGTDGSLGGSNAFIGAGSVSVEEVRWIKDLETDLSL